jgi:hypothetical protein
LRGERKVEKSNWYRTRGEENEIQRERGGGKNINSIWKSIDHLH